MQTYIKTFLIFFLVSLTGCGCKKLKKQQKKPSINSQTFFKEAYENTSGVISDEEREMINNKGGSPIYGEILPESLRIILDELNVQPSDVFYDLGSGLGKVTIQAYLDYPFKKSVGIELSPTRCNQAINKIQILEAKGHIDSDRILECRNGDITEEDFNDATIIFMCATCYSDELMQKLIEKLSKLKRGLKVITLRNLPDYEEYGFKFIKEYNLPMTWSKNSSVYLYELKK